MNYYDREIVNYELLCPKIFERKLKYGDVLQKSSHDRNVCTFFFI